MVATGAVGESAETGLRGGGLASRGAATMGWLGATAAGAGVAGPSDAVAELRNACCFTITARAASRMADRTGTRALVVGRWLAGLGMPQ